MADNSNLHKAMKGKNDEFYTQMEDIVNELKHYDLSGKSIYCNCDNPEKSNFYKYFKDNFHELGITHLIATGYNPNGNGYYGSYDGENEILKPLINNGDFRSEECIEILKTCDVIVTNPPFSLFRQYAKQLMDYGKQFIIMGSTNAITYKEIFPYLKDGDIWCGLNNHKAYAFEIPDNYEKSKAIYEKNGKRYLKIPSISWYTNVVYESPKKTLVLTKTYNPQDYPKYDNYDAIEVGRIKDIPVDYDGVMGVPITFLLYYTDDYEILGLANDAKEDNDYIIKGKPTCCNGVNRVSMVLNDKALYARILIKRKNIL